MATEISPQSTDDVVLVLTSQHERARELLAELRESVAVVAELTRDMAGPFRELVQLLVAHETAEELVVYPALKTELEEGRLAEACIAEEHEAKHMLAKLEKMAPGFFEFPDVLAEFDAKLLAHAEHEEQSVFPILEQRLAPDERHKLGGDFLHAAATAPSHAHAHSPESAVGNALFGPVLATIDRVRDAVHRPHPGLGQGPHELEAGVGAANPPDES
jgi:hemerythrin-like domain-containing protein